MFVDYQTISFMIRFLFSKCFMNIGNTAHCFSHVKNTFIVLMCKAHIDIVRVNTSILISKWICNNLQSTVTLVSKIASLYSMKGTILCSFIPCRDCSKTTLLFPNSLCYSHRTHINAVLVILESQANWARPYCDIPLGTISVRVK